MTVSIYRVYRTTEGGSKCCIETLQVITLRDKLKEKPEAISQQT